MNPGEQSYPRSQVGQQANPSWQDKLAVWRHFASYFAAAPRGIAASIFGSVLRSLLAIPMVLLLRQVLDNAIPARDAGQLAILCAALFGLRVVHTSATYGLRVLNIRITEAAVLALRKDLLAHLYRISRGYFAAHDEGSLHTLLVQDSTRAKRLGYALLGEIVPGFVSAALLLGLLFFLNPAMAGLLLLFAPPMLGLTRMVARRAETKVTAFHRAFERYAQGVLLVLRTMDLTQALGQERHQLEDQGSRLEDLRLRESQMAKTYAAHGQVQSMAVSVSAVAILFLGGLTVIRGGMSLGEFFAFYFVATLLNQTAMASLAALPELIDGHRSLCDLHQFADTAELQPYNGQGGIDFHGTLRCENISFSYGANPVLRKLSVTFEAGTINVLRGSNGAGKTTLLMLLLGFYRPDTGQLEADGIAYDSIDLSALRRSIGTVLQSPGLFTGSVRANLSYGHPHCEDAAIQAACVRAGAHEFIQSLPQGYDTQVGDDAMQLSGGQRQRIALARALLGKPSLLLLDEPTTYLDDAATRAFVAMLKALPPTLTVILVTHDPALTAAADRVYELSNGSISQARPESAVRAVC